MDNIAYVALSRQTTLRREMDVIANNIANADTTGFKVESLMVETAPVAPAATMDAPNPVNFVTNAGITRDFGQGALQQTSRPVDLALEGDGFFMVEIQPGTYRFTRNGAFNTDESGRLVTSEGHPVLDANYNAISMNPAAGPPTVSEDGTIFQGATQVARLAVVRFPVTRNLTKVSDNYYGHPPNEPPVPAEDARVRQGMREASNVRPIVEITNMIEVQRVYERVSRIVDTTEDLSRRAVERLGEVKG